MSKYKKITLNRYNLDISDPYKRSYDY